MDASPGDKKCPTPLPAPHKWGGIVLRRLDSFRQEGVFCDTLLETLDGSFFLAHSCVLAAASPFMYVQLVDLGLEATSVLLPLPGAALECCLRYMYSGEWNWKSSDCDLDQLCEVAKVLGLPPCFETTSTMTVADESGVESCLDDSITPTKLPSLPARTAAKYAVSATTHVSSDWYPVNGGGSESETEPVCAEPEPYQHTCSPEVEYKMYGSRADEREYTQGAVPWSSLQSRKNWTTVHHRCKYCMRTYTDRTELFKHEVWHKESDQGARYSRVTDGGQGQLSSQLLNIADEDAWEQSVGSQRPSSGASLDAMFQEPDCSSQPVTKQRRPRSADLLSRRESHDPGAVVHRSMVEVSETRSTSLSSDHQSGSYSLEANAIVETDREYNTLATSTIRQKSNLSPQPMSGELAVESQVSSTVCKDIDAGGEGRLIIDEAQSTSKMYRCGMCTTAYNSRSQLRTHEKKNNHGHQKHFRCKYCHLVYTSHALKVAHEESHGSEDLPYHCYFCDARFAWKKEKNFHESVHREKNKPFKCSVCQKNFTAKTSYIYHTRLHSGEKPFQCRYCSKTFTGSGNRNKHESTHTQTKHYKRLLCDKYFADTGGAPQKEDSRSQTPPSTRVNVKQYVQSSEPRPGNHGDGAAETVQDTPPVQVSDNSPTAAISDRTSGPNNSPLPDGDKELRRKFHKCHRCKQCFTSRADLIGHKKMHAPGDRYRCQYCDRSFSSKPSLNCHVRLHSGEKPYHCHFCDESFVQTTSLRIHESKHTGNKPHACSFCGKTFVFRSAMTAHERTHTKERPYKCQYCEKAFVSSGSRRIHEKCHLSKVLHASRE